MELDAFFAHSVNCLKFVGYNPFESFRFELQSVLKLSLMVISLFGLLLSAAFSGVFVLMRLEDITRSGIAVVNCIKLSETVFKPLAIWFYRQEILDLIKLLRQFFPNSDNETTKAFVKNSFASFSKFQKIYTFMFALFGVMEIVGGLSKMSSGELNNDTLQHPMWIPIEIDSALKYFVVFFALEFISIACKFYVVGGELFFIALIIVLSIEFEVFAMEFQKIDFKDSEDFKVVLRFVKRHEVLLEMVERLERIFSSSLSFSVLISAVSLSFPAVQAITAEDPADVMKCFVCIQFLILQIFLICFYGEKLKSSSLSISEGVMTSNWYECKDKRVVDALRMIVLRSQKPSQVTAMKFVSVSIETFASVS